MPETIAPSPSDAAAGELEYLWTFVRPIDDASKELLAGLAERQHRSFEYFRADIYGTDPENEWPTMSWLEVGFSKSSGDFRILWKSGMGPTQELPDNLLTDWGNGTGPEDTLEQLTQQMKNEGRPLLGVCTVQPVRDGVRGYRDAPRIIGFDFNPGLQK
ncbi:hypothetical protein NOI24_24570 [Neorhizobium galegae]|uniref:hypothetical protein n=1 Tax=Neorhizobium galegae TaxID=399 RepID=UPI002106B128|nr:hypothetical protein [Neorhizobium galegae]MCQ1774486.1 hypothetical protein [Neorhizobium galegae]MCQ1798563.1 hypothetical protein [Neorhizobium galegae]